jgi:hypothetical protein
MAERQDARAGEDGDEQQRERGAPPAPRTPSLDLREDAEASLATPT